jgi:hypothetical protein
LRPAAAEYARGGRSRGAATPRAMASDAEKVGVEEARREIAGGEATAGLR